MEATPRADTIRGESEREGVPLTTQRASTQRFESRHHVLEPTDRLRARPGDRLVIRTHQTGSPGGYARRDAEILATLGEGGAPPFLVRWQDDGRESEIFPGGDAYVEHLTAHAGVAETG